MDDSMDDLGVVLSVTFHLSRSKKTTLGDNQLTKYQRIINVDQEEFKWLFHY